MARTGALKQRKTQDGEEAPEPKPQKINLDDANAIKHALDSTAAEVSRCSCADRAAVMHVACAVPKRAAHLPQTRAQRRCQCLGMQHPWQPLRHMRPLQVVLDAGYIEDHLISNVKIVLGFAA